MGNTAFRIYFLTAVVLATYGAVKWEKYALQPPSVQLPSWTFDDLPLQFGEWRGENTNLDPEIAKAVGAAKDRIVDRAYQDGFGHTITMHTAMFNDPVEGLYHSPLNCYRSNGWERTKLTTEELHLSDGLTIPVSMSTWKLEGRRVLVVYWYQLGEYVLFGRWDLGIKVRWKLAGKSKWPPLIKVMLQIDALEAEEAKTVIMGFAEQVAGWENHPQRRKELLLIGDQSAEQDAKSGQ